MQNLTKHLNVFWNSFLLKLRTFKHLVVVYICKSKIFLIAVCSFYCYFSTFSLCKLWHSICMVHVMKLRIEIKEFMFSWHDCAIFKKPVALCLILTCSCPKSSSKLVFVLQILVTKKEICKNFYFKHKWIKNVLN